MAGSRPWRDFGNTREWLEQTGLLTEEAGDMPPPPFPYQVYEDRITAAGPDNAPWMLMYHDVTVEQYQESMDQSHVGILEALLASEEVEYIHDRFYIGSEKMYMDLFEFRIIHKNTRKKGL